VGILGKLAALIFNLRYFSGFQAIVVPERTSLYLRRMGLRHPRFVWTRHGAGDRAIGFAKDIRSFDFVVLSGRKIEERLLSDGSIKPGQYHRGAYVKFDIVKRLKQHRRRLFDNDRPTIIYNPHFKRAFSSWFSIGNRILDHFANQERYNLIFAPHYRLFDGRQRASADLARRYAHCPHMLIDTGSIRSVDMTYTMAADLYLGDVSSQIAEFLIEPRPCLFLNSHRYSWQNDPNFRFWTLGEVVESADNIDMALQYAFDAHGEFLEAQRQYVLETFEFPHDGPTAPAAADAIVTYLRRAARLAVATP